MTDSSTFELHSFENSSLNSTEQSGVDLAFGGLAWNEETERKVSVLQFNGSDSEQGGPLWVGIDHQSGMPCRVHSPAGAVAGFSVVARRLSQALSMISPVEHAGLLVNGIPALRFSVLSPRDSVVLTHGVHSYVTERIRPYVGKPPKDMISMKCPFCKIPFSEDTQIVTCRCGVAYHFETDKSHPEIEEEERLNCLSRLQVCLSCSRPVSLEESLVWDPQTL